MDVIFHHPLPVLPAGTSGSRVRPYQMLEAFRGLGYDIEEVVGFGGERARAIARVREQMRAGRRFAFAYAESSTMPTPLTDPHHLPVRPRMDFAFFRELGRYGVPLGLFYRDVHWRFENYRAQVPWRKRAVAIPFYRYEWWQYRRHVQHLFLPSLAMLPALPTEWPMERVSALPPGCLPGQAPAAPEGDGGLGLIYVGGVTPPLYDLRSALSAVARTEGVELTLCCRSAEWEAAGKLYDHGCGRVRVVHAHGPDLGELYRAAAAFLLYWRPAAYLDFAVPVKVFESLSYGLPVITAAGTEVARFVERERIGWVVSGEDELSRLLTRLRERPAEVAQMRERVCAVRERHTWRMRAVEVARVLAGGAPADQTGREAEQRVSAAGEW